MIFMEISFIFKIQLIIVITTLYCSTRKFTGTAIMDTILTTGKNLQMEGYLNNIFEEFRMHLRKAEQYFHPNIDQKQPKSTISSYNIHKTTPESTTTQKKTTPHCQTNTSKPQIQNKFPQKVSHPTSQQQNILQILNNYIKLTECLRQQINYLYSIKDKLQNQLTEIQSNNTNLKQNIQKLIKENKQLQEKLEEEEYNNTELTEKLEILSQSVEKAKQEISEIKLTKKDQEEEYEAVHQRFHLEIEKMREKNQKYKLKAEQYRNERDQLAMEIQKARLQLQGGTIRQYFPNSSHQLKTYKQNYY